MGDPAKRRATYDDLVAVPEHLIAEIIDGELVTQPRPAVLHALATSRLVTEIGTPFDRGKGGPGGWVILYEPELHLGGNVIVPDVAGWRRERMPEVPEGVGIEIAPDWVCEALSPGTAARDRSRKMPIYAAEKVGHVWLVDPAVKTLEVFRLEGGGWRLLGTWEGAVSARVEPFDAVEIDIGALWAR